MAQPIIDENSNKPLKKIQTTLDQLQKEMEILKKENRETVPLLNFEKSSL